MLLLTRPKCFFLMGITQTLFRMKSDGYIMVKSLFLKKNNDSLQSKQKNQ